MTIQELLVKDGYWPTKHGPKGYNYKPQYPWVVYNSWEGKLDTKTSNFKYLIIKNHLPTVTCSSTEEGVMT
jgi:hypothetical protein